MKSRGSRWPTPCSSSDHATPARRRGGRGGKDAPLKTACLIGSAPAIVALQERIRQLARFDAVGGALVPTVLLLGETGTGKGHVARLIHETGPRSSRPFVSVNCAAIPATMLDAELFGIEAGAFTDAKRAKPGLLEAASGGTLLLDEVDSLELPLQRVVSQFDFCRCEGIPTS